MSQSKIKPRSVRRQTRGTGQVPEEEKKSSKKSRFILAAVILAILGIAIGIGYYFIYVVPLQHTIIKVNNAEINIDYFVRRMLISGTTDDIFTMIDTITNEELIRQVAPKPPYNIEATEDQLMAELRVSARGENETISDAEFKSWYRDQRNESGLSDKEFKELSRTYLMASYMAEYLAERVSSVAEQVHLHMILVSGYEETTEVFERLDAGEDFFAVAQELSADAAGGEEASELGWWPREALGIKSDTYYLTPPEWMFDLGIGAYSEPTIMDQESQTYAIFMVSERSPAREIDAEKLDIVKGRQLEMWLDSEASRNIITLHGRNNGIDSETHAWISWQISRRLKAE
ncbi:MAG TPA: hypothetical protein G4O07_07575 [Dehalococcoidia bacterium]|nr:hypothetical protein [Dehalococcoidia bacterium]